VSSGGKRVRLQARDEARRGSLAAMLEAAGHELVTEAPDLVLCDLADGEPVPSEDEAPVVILTDVTPRGTLPAGALPRGATSEQLDLAVRGVAAGLLVRAPGMPRADGFRAAEEALTLTPREAEVLALVGQGMSNKSVARRLGISVHTVKFHLEALFAKLDATSRAEAVAKGLRGGMIEL
jgi:two-component system nitrate/nitrite response regulator NarL